jgi:predicted MFS family arabinose efflux permease
MIAALFLETLSRLVLPFAAGPPLAAAAVVAASQALLGLTVPLWTINSNSLQQAVTPERLLGRVSAATRFVSWGVAPPSALAAGLLADHIGLRVTLFASGLIAAIAFVYLLASPVRRFRHPEAITDTAVDILPP